MTGWKNNACLQANTIFLLKFSSILRLSKTIFWVTFTIWKCFSCHSQVPIYMPTTEHNRNEHVAIHVHLGSHQAETMENITRVLPYPSSHVSTRTTGGQPTPISSTQQSPVSHAHACVIAVCTAIHRILPVCLCFYSPYSLTVFSIISLIFFLSSLILFSSS